MVMDHFSVEYALLAIQSALLHEITPALRTVFINVDDEEVFYAHFYYDGEVSEQRIDLWDCVITEASAALGPCFVKCWIKRLDYPAPMSVSGYCAYLRKEGNGLHLLKGDIPRIPMREPTIGYALIAVQQALLGMVSPELRSVVVDFEKEPLRLYVRFYHDKEIPEELQLCWKAAQEAAQAYFGFDCSLDAAIERVDYPQKMPFRGRYAYLRNE